jgi:hypothetical protein
MERGNELRSPPPFKEYSSSVLPELNIIICLDFLYLSVGEEINEML